MWPILVDGELSPYAQYELKAYPRERTPRFRVILNAPSAIWRIDFDCEPYHANSLSGPRSRPHDLPWDVGPRHYHAWADNRYLFRACYGLGWQIYWSGCSVLIGPQPSYLAALLDRASHRQKDEPARAMESRAWQL